MSRQLLNAAILDKPYLQSPVDDLLSFYYVSQWAAVNNTKDFAEPIAPTAVPDELKLLRQRLGSSEREDATSTITQDFLDEKSYGAFLVACQPILQEWYEQLKKLMVAWQVRTKNLDPDVAQQYATYYPLFREFTDRGVLELLQLVQSHFAGGLKGLA
jgi:hypothetical protein